MRLKLGFLFLLVVLNCFQVKAQTNEDLIEKIGEINTYIENDPKQALDDAIEILKIASLKDLPESMAAAHHLIAFILNQQGIFTQSVEHYLLATEYFLHTGDSLKSGWLNVDVGNLYFHHKFFEKAKEHYTKAIKIFELAGPPTSLATAYNNLGLVAIEEKDYQLALNYFNIGLKLRESHNVIPYNLIHSYKYIGDIYLLLGDSAEAMKYYNKIIESKLHNLGANLRGEVHHTLADIFLKKGDKAKAKDELLKALDDYTSNSNQEYICLISSELAQSAFEEGNDALGVKYLREVLKISNENNLLDYKKNALSALSNHYFKKHDFNQFFEYDKQQDSIAEEINRLAINKAILSLDAESRAARLQKDLSQTNDLLQKNIQIRNIVIFFGILIIFSFVYILWSFYQKRKSTEALNKWKLKLFSVLGHDLRSPFNSIIGLSEMLKEDDALTKQVQVEMATAIHTTSQRTYLLLENLLSWIKAQDAELLCKMGKLNFYNLANGIISEFERGAAIKQIKIYNEIPENCSIVADEMMISVVLRNLLSNAVKFTQTSGMVSISYKKERDKIEICVEDNGVGLSPEKINLVLNNREFYSEYGTDHERGTGLGINICKEFIQKMKGSLKIESENGKGSRFIIVLPD